MSSADSADHAYGLLETFMAIATCAAPESLFDEHSIHQAIERRARELWELRGRTDGHAEEDWRQAESEITTQLAARHLHPMRLIQIKTEGVIYTGEYDPDASQDYHPGDFGPGAPVRIRFHDNRMTVTLPGERTLETRIVSAETTASLPDPSVSWPGLSAEGEPSPQELYPDPAKLQAKESKLHPHPSPQGAE
jgi:hypothetical protein